MPGKGWINVCIPEKLMELIDRTVQDKGKWRSRAEFVREAIRRHLEHEESQTLEKET